MHITVIGTGFVGVVTTAVLAKFHPKIVGLDVNTEKITALKQGKAPFFEPGLDALLQNGIEKGRLHFTTDYHEAIPHADVIIIAVGTPSRPDGSADLSSLHSTITAIAPLLKENVIIAIKSTVPPGTNNKLKDMLQQAASVKFYLTSLPEFLREGSAVEDTLHPDRIVIGSNDDYSIQILKNIHQPIGAKMVVISPESAQMAKYAANAYLALRIAYINQIADLCEKSNASISEVIKTIGEDKRIGNHYWYPGLGYGGSCFPKDVKELSRYAAEVGESNNLLSKIDELNESRINKKLIQFSQEIDGLNGKKVAVLGLSFKPNTTDMREAPSLKVVPFLQHAGARVVGYDPQAEPLAHQLMPQMILSDSPYDASKEADVIILLIEWDEVRHLDLHQLSKTAKRGAIFIDTRNQYRRQDVESVGMKYLSIGNS